jgi:4-amino-4-deoxy-L-arabinose transferase-like glycosyltransferase
MAMGNRPLGSVFKRLPDGSVLLLLLAVFWIGALRQAELPGLYMDGVNPDYWAARTLHPELKNPIWIMPRKWIPLLGNIYYGVQTYYLSLPFYWLLGMNVVTVRISQAMFGAAIVAFTYGLLFRATASRAIALTAALALATDVSFLASFRTQNYIILAGEAWLFASLLLLYPRDGEAPRGQRTVFASGVCYGLAIYGYFVLGFFLPAMLYVVSVLRRSEWRSAGITWMRGMAVGLLTYALGYLLMAWGVGGLDAFVDFLRKLIHRLAPFSSPLSLLGAYEYAYGMTKLVVANGGNELMIFGEQVTSGAWTTIKFVGVLAVVAALFILLATLRMRSPGDLRAYARLSLVLLPCSFFLVSGLFGQRLWAHHFSVLVPVFYLLVGVLLHEILRLPIGRISADLRTRVQHGIVAFVCGALVLGNFFQQQQFFEKLEDTGGVGKLSNALTILAELALENRPDAVYLFPDWGFFMSFALLSGNRVPYVLQVSPQMVTDLSRKYRSLNIAFWSPTDIDKYKAALRLAGSSEPRVDIFRQRDGRAAFYMVSATYPTGKDQRANQ